MKRQKYLRDSIYLAIHFNCLFVWFDLILYVPSTIFQLNMDGSSWVEPVLMLGLHYVHGSHGSHGSQKRSSPWCFKSFLSLCSSSVKSRYVFSWSVKVCRDRGSTARYGVSRMVLRFIPACHVLLGPLTFCYVAIKYCYVYQVLSRFSTTSISFSKKLAVA